MDNRDQCALYNVKGLAQLYGCSSDLAKLFMALYSVTLFLVDAKSSIKIADGRSEDPLLFLVAFIRSFRIDPFFFIYQLRYR